MAVRALRGAVQIDADDRALMFPAVVELVTAVLEQNQLKAQDVISIVFTATPDLTCDFPAAAARSTGLEGVPLLCASEIDVPGALPRVVRLMAHVETDLPREKLRHVYLGGATALRPDLSSPQ